MARFDVYGLKNNPRILVVDIQAELFSDLRTRVVVPLVPYSQAKNESMIKLKPILEFNQKKYVLMTTELGAVSTKDLDDCGGNLEKHRIQIIEALDFLFQGF